MTVVHCKRAPYTYYIGRPSVLGNPFTHKSGTLAKYKVSSVEEAIEQFRIYALDSPRVLAAIFALPHDAVLGCWCKPGPCHGDVIIDIYNNHQVGSGASDSRPK